MHRGSRLEKVLLRYSLHYNRRVFKKRFPDAVSASEYLFFVFQKTECIYDFLINVEEISAVKGIASIIPMLDEIPLIVSRTINAVENR